MYSNVFKEHNAHFLLNKGLQAEGVDLGKLSLGALGRTEKRKKTLQAHGQSISQCFSFHVHK